MSTKGEGIEPLLNTDEVAKLVGLHSVTLAEWRTQGRGPRWVKLGRKVRYRPRDVEAWLDQNERTSTRISG